MTTTDRMDNTNRIDENNGLSPWRRNFLRTAGGVVILASASLTNQATAQSNQSGLFSNNPFSLGVASGDPLPDSVVLWTRLAPEPTEKGGGMPDRQVPIQWQVATDEDMRDTVRRGNTKAFPEYAHLVHVDVRGLNANTEYYYQFKVGPCYSSVARTKTAPADRISIDEFNFAFASCQAWCEEFDPAYRYMAEDNRSVVTD